jgi:hypothetical protein
MPLLLLLLGLCFQLISLARAEDLALSLHPSQPTVLETFTIFARTTASRSIKRIKLSTKKWNQIVELPSK